MKNIQKIEKELQNALNIGWSRLKLSSDFSVYSNLYTWLMNKGFYESQYRNIIPNPAYDNAVKDLGKEFIETLTLNALSIKDSFPGSFSRSIESEEGDYETRIFNITLFKNNLPIYNAKLTFPHLHDKFDFILPPTIDLSNSRIRYTNFTIKALKYKDIQYRTFNDNTLLEENDNYIILYSKSNNKILNHKNDYIWNTQCPAFVIFPKSELYNIVIMMKDNNIIEYYINISSTPDIINNIISYIDYDVDISYFPVSNSITVHDTDEFTLNKLNFNYPSEIINNIDNLTESLISLCRNKQFYFSSDFLAYCMSKIS